MSSNLKFEESISLTLLEKKSECRAVVKLHIDTYSELCENMGWSNFDVMCIYL